jgi:coproporphyrinogen III oxidase-like Fe-S oxidoreductase
MQSPGRASAPALRSRTRATATPRDAAPPDPPSTARARRVWTPRAPLEPVASAYVHLPFCRRRCYYCDFAVSVVGDAHETSDAVTRGMETYVETLSREIANTPSAPSSRGRRRHHPPLRTIFFGGGTPSLLPPALLRRVLDALRARFGIDADAEISMEVRARRPRSLSRATTRPRFLGFVRRHRCPRARDRVVSYSRVI